jgi:cystathionine gamma-synthase
MTPEQLQSEPLWRATALGQPMPGSPHAVTVAIPRWLDVVCYEEKRP